MKAPNRAEVANWADVRSGRHLGDGKNAARGLRFFRGQLLFCARLRRWGNQNDGTTFAALPGQPPDELFRPISGRRVLVESLARQSRVPPGGLLGTREGRRPALVSAQRIDAPRLAEIRQRVLATLREDERVVEVECTASFDAAASSLRLDRRRERRGPFTFVLGVSAARVEVFGFTEG